MCISKYLNKIYYKIYCKIGWKIYDKWLFIKSYKHKISRWFDYRSTIFTSYESDYSSLLLLERKQLKRMIAIGKKYDYTFNQRDIERMQLAVNLIDIIVDEAFQFIDYDTPHYKGVFTRKVNRNNLDLGYTLNECYLDAATYYEKAWKIYNKLRYYYLRTWWT